MLFFLYLQYKREAEENLKKDNHEGPVEGDSFAFMSKSPTEL